MTSEPTAGATQWLSSEEAARRLGVRTGTLYSYVSRGVVRSFPAPDGRSSRFDRTDIEALLNRRRSNPGGAADAVVASRITKLGEDGVRYRGYAVAHLAAIRTYEEVAALLWDVAVVPAPWPFVPLDLPAAAVGATLCDLLRIAIAVAAPLDVHRHDLRPDAVAASARRLVASMVASLPVTAKTCARLVVDGRRIDGSIASALAARLGAHRVEASTVRAVNTALVLLADHELATSTYGVRVAASTRADVYSTVLAGAASGGPLHVGASRETAELLRDAADRGPAVALSDLLRSGRMVPGFGHKIYRRDPRFPDLFDLVLAGGFPTRRTDLVQEMLALIGERVPVEPNVDFAGAALAYCAGMRTDAAEAIFLVARSAGWVAHTIEEYGEQPLRFRTRGLYTGDPPHP